MNFLNYTVYKRGELLATIEDAGITSFTDKGHVLDNGDWYNVKANFEDDVSWYVGYKILPNDNITIEQVEDLSAIDFCTVKWSNGKGYKCKWNIYVNQELKMKETEETSISIPAMRLRHTAVRSPLYPGRSSCLRRSGQRFLYVFSK